ncbi:MAG: aminodeoxychorismate synthase component I [Deltaproteobacteria bacterium]|nr:aminodeoxychorismate synthase component I [Deltaproteobacteria bacterium]
MAIKKGLALLDELIKTAGKITGIYSEPVVLQEEFCDFAARFVSIPGTVLLMSGGDLDCARYHILATMPWLSLTGRKDNITIMAGDRQFHYKADPFDIVQKILNAYSMEGSGQPIPFGAGLAGYLSYDLKDCLENLPRTSVDDLYLPHICLFAPSIIIIHDRNDSSTLLNIPKRIYSGKSALDNDIDRFQKIFRARPPIAGGFSGNNRGFKSGFTRAQFIDAIIRIKEYISAGHAYQVNMSQRFEMDFSGDSFSLFRTLYNDNPAPFFAYINAGDHKIISTSPERFLLQTGREVETRPIKGTRPRGITPSEDKRLAQELSESRKDDAELSMIVDLMRNDLGRVCTAGSVRVTEHKRLESYANVYHLVSIVNGRLREETDSVDLIRATFPGGSITGCPKIRAMEIIDELEPCRRHVYTGSIGYISFHDTMDLSIAIRTAEICDGRIVFSVGGGIVYDSDPGDEYAETLDKGKTLMEVFKRKGEKIRAGNLVWINGAIKPVDQASIPVSTPGFQYGYGFFETIRVEKGRPGFLRRHIDRFSRTWEELFSADVPDLTWNHIINRVIAENGLERETAAVKIIAAKGDRESPPYNHTLLVTARPYTPRLEGKNEQGLKIVTYPRPRQTPLADHKTLNYLYYLIAAKWANRKGADEALIMNPDGTISETNTANIFFIKRKRIIMPASPHVLPGVMQAEVFELLSSRGYGIEKKKVKKNDLFSFDDILVSNSLIGVLPVLSIDGRRLKKPSGLWLEINDKVL